MMKPLDTARGTVEDSRPDFKEMPEDTYAATVTMDSFSGPIPNASRASGGAGTTGEQDAGASKGVAPKEL